MVESRVVINPCGAPSHVTARALPPSRARSASSRASELRGLVQPSSPSALSPARAAAPVGRAAALVLLRAGGAGAGAAVRGRRAHPPAAAAARHRHAGARGPEQRASAGRAAAERGGDPHGGLAAAAGGGRLLVQRAQRGRGVGALRRLRGVDARARAAVGARGHRHRAQHRRGAGRAPQPAGAAACPAAHLSLHRGEPRDVPGAGAQHPRGRLSRGRVRVSVHPHGARGGHGGAAAHHGDDRPEGGPRDRDAVHELRAAARARVPGLLRAALSRRGRGRDGRRRGGGAGPAAAPVVGRARARPAPGPPPHGRHPRLQPGRLRGAGVPGAAGGLRLGRARGDGGCHRARRGPHPAHAHRPARAGPAARHLAGGARGRRRAAGPARARRPRPPRRRRRSERTRATRRRLAAQPHPSSPIPPRERQPHAEDAGKGARGELSAPPCPLCCSPRPPREPCRCGLCERWHVGCAPGAAPRDGGGRWRLPWRKTMAGRDDGAALEAIRAAALPLTGGERRLGRADGAGGRRAAGAAGRGVARHARVLPRPGARSRGG